MQERADALQQAIARAWSEVETYVEESQPFPGNGFIPTSLISVAELIDDEAADEKVTASSSPIELEVPH